MNWTSPEMLGWIVATTAAAWVAPRRAQPLAIVALSAGFLGLASPVSALLLALFALGSHFGLGPRPSIGRLSIGIGAVVAIVVAYKAGVDTGAHVDPSEIAVPLGLSYFSFRVIHYMIERYKGTLPEHDFGHYVTYLFFLPILMAGPMSRFEDFRRDLRRRRFDARVFSQGLERIIHGFAKIVILANGVVSVWFAGWIESRFPEPTALAEYLDCLRFGLNLYLQFSGFSDVAIGFGLLLGFRIAENFQNPFIARNIADFWQRWHITLSSWCRDYVYMPVAAATRRPIVAILAAMLVLGLWHELSFRFLVWGLYHGIGIAVFRLFERIRPQRFTARSAIARFLARAAGMTLTVNFVMLSFVITKERELGEAIAIYQTLLLGLFGSLLGSLFGPLVGPG